MIRRLAPFAAVALVSLAALTACSSTSASSPSSAATVSAAAASPSAAASAAASSDAARSSITVTSAYGDVEVPASTERVAAVSYNTPWQLQSLGVKPVATIDYTAWLDSYTADQQTFIADAEAIGTYGELNFEALAAAKPDLIIGDAYEVDEPTYKRLTAIAPTVIVGGEDRGDWQSVTEQVAAAVGRTDTWETSKTEYEALRDKTKADYADVISGNTWVNFSFGDDAGQFSVQLPTGDTGNLIVNEMGLTYGAGVPMDDPDNYGYVSLPVEQLPTVFDGVTAALTFVQADGSSYDGIKAITDSDLFGSLDVAKSGQVYGLSTSVTDYETAMTWINELTAKVLEPLSS